jgi:hypothetical protein
MTNLSFNIPPMSLYSKIPPTERAAFLEELLDHYVERQGLGAMPKADFDALLVHLFLKWSKEQFDSFTLSDHFRIKETRLKSLIETAAVKFEKREIHIIWFDILKQWENSITSVDRMESGEVRFKFENPAYFRYLQREVRSLGGTVRYDRASEAVTLGLDLLFGILNRVHGSIFKNYPGTQAVVIQLLEKIRKDIIGNTQLKLIKEDKDNRLKITQIISTASKLGSIGKLVVTAFAL